MLNRTVDSTYFGLNSPKKWWRLPLLLCFASYRSERCWQKGSFLGIDGVRGSNDIWNLNFFFSEQDIDTLFILYHILYFWRNKSRKKWWDMFTFHPNHLKFCHSQFIYLVSLTAHNLRLGSIFALLGKSNSCRQVEMKRSYCAFHIHENWKLPAVTIAFFAAVNHYDHKQWTLKHKKMDQNLPITDHKPWPFDPV